jgi:hypothetical protein
MVRRQRAGWVAAAGVVEATLLLASYWFSTHGDRSQRFYGVTYEQNPLGWFVMTAVMVHFLAMIVLAPVAAVAFCFWMAGRPPSRTPNDKRTGGESRR